MKNILKVLVLMSSWSTYSSLAVAATSAKPQVQMILQSCEAPDNSATVKSIEVYGVVDDGTGEISNLSVLEVVSFDVGDLKMIIQGGEISGSPGTNVVYDHIMGGDGRLTIQDNVGTLTYKGQQTIFSHCK